MLKSVLCDVLRIEHPIIQAPIGSACTPELAAAVSNAGGLGMLALSWRTPAECRELVRRTRELTDKPFGANFVLEWDQRPRVNACLDAGLKIISTFWGDPVHYVPISHKAEAIHIHTVGSAADAKRAMRAGVDIFVAQGWEAGGHVWGGVSTMALVPAVADMVAPRPVVAAGGIADGRGIAAALMLGASGVWLGTRFLASEEANAHPIYKRAILDAAETGTVHTGLFDGGWENAPHRVLRNSTVRNWEMAGRPPRTERPSEGEVVALQGNGDTIQRYDDTFPLIDTTGEVESLALYAGQSAGLVRAVQPAAEIMRTLIASTEENLRKFAN